MGLDMYLSATRFTSGASWANDPLNAKLRETLGPDGPPLSDNQNYIELDVEVAYWRKANQIHGWFVTHVQDGVDDCRKAYVGVDHLCTLLTTCKAVLAIKGTEADPITEAEKINALLPPTQGFFFGGYKIDEWYWQDIEQTIERLEKILAWYNKHGKGWSFRYHSSW